MSISSTVYIYISRQFANQQAKAMLLYTQLSLLQRAIDLDLPLSEEEKSLLDTYEKLLDKLIPLLYTWEISDMINFSDTTFYSIVED